MTRHVSLPPADALQPNGLYLGGWWHDADESGRIVCDLCPRECSLKPGDRGFCFVRQNIDGQMYLTTYGRSTGFCIDPIEKKPLNHFLPGTSVLSFGTAGCNLGCKFCQNWDISKSREVERLSEEAGPEAVAEAALQTGSRSVAYTYNDPVIWAEYAMDTARACRARGIKNVAVTAGYISPAARAPFYEYMDAANVDLKAFTEDFYFKITYSHLQPVLDTLEWLKKETAVWFEITNLMIPDANDSPHEVAQMCDWILDHVGDSVPVHFTAFHPDFRMRDRAATPHATLLAAYEIAQQRGLKYVYVGNVNDVVHQSTYCSNCKKLLIERNWYELGAYNLDHNRCRFCNTEVAGVFESSPGEWGRKRVPVSMAKYAQLLPTVSNSTVSNSTVSNSTVSNSTVSNSTVSNSTASGSTNTQSPTRNSSNQPITSPEQASSSLATRALNAGESVMSTTQSTSELSSPRIQAQRPKLDEGQEHAIHHCACEIVAAAIQGRAVQLADPTLLGAHEKTVMGAFVTLKRQGKLRACCGALGRPMRLLDALVQAAQRTALEDGRLPPISATELPYVELDVTLLYGFQPIHAEGRDRVQHVVVGRHGLQISRGNNAGLLLPSVATDHGYDAENFLQQVCRKAGLPTNAWQEPSTTVQTFECVSVDGDFSAQHIRSDSVERPAQFTGEDITQMAFHCGNNIVALLQGATPSYYLIGVSDGTVQGVNLSLTFPQSTEPMHLFRLALRPGLPLQSTLFGLCEAAAASLASQRLTAQQISGFMVGLSILDDSSMHGTVEEPDLRGIDPTKRAVLVMEGGKSGLVFHPALTPESLVREAAEAAQVVNPEAAGVLSLSILSSETSLHVSNVPRPITGPAVRQPAVAGTFYPSDAGELANWVDDFLGEIPSSTEDFAAIMVPHAGLKYSGHVAAKTMRRTHIPNTVIVIGPKHTRLGSGWAVAPHEQWSIPGITLASDVELAKELCAAIPGLQMDAAAHVQEHGIEVELPFLARLNPEVKVVGIAIGAGSLDKCKEFARGLAGVLERRHPRPLLVISSDMNHYANDAETRELDELAIKSLETLDPATVHRTVTQHGVSMCGVLPAVIVLETLRLLGVPPSVERIEYATSAAVSGDFDRVVGYAGMVFGRLAK